MWTSLAPQLPVADVGRALAYYRDVLGCRIAWIWEDSYAAVFNGDTAIHFVKADHPRPGAGCYVYVPSADELYARYRAAGADVVEDLASKPWGMREFAVRDPDGHVLRIGHGEKTVAGIPQFRTEP